MMKRKSLLVLSLLFAAAVLLGLQTASAAIRYKDETDTGCWKWAGTAIHWATDRDVARGMDTGRFEPQQNITRAQAYTMLVRLYEQYGTISSVDPEAEIFVDCKNAWYTEPIRKAISGGLLEYQPGILLRPNEQITRREAAAILFGLPRLKQELDNSVWKEDLSHLESEFDDVLPGSKNVLEIKLARRLYIVRGCGQNRFQPDRKVTRAEFVKMLYRAALVQEREKFQPEDLSVILAQASSVVYQKSESFVPSMDEASCTELSSSQVKELFQTLSGREWTDVQETPDNLPDGWLHVLDEEKLPVLSLGVEERTDGSLYLFVWQNQLWHEHDYIIENVRLSLPQK